MKLKKRLVGLMLAAALATLPATFTACFETGGDSSSSSSSTATDSSSSSSVVESVPFEDIGEYYCSASAGEYTLTISAIHCQLVMGSENLSGTYEYDGEVLTLKFSGAESATATLDGTVLTLKRGNNTYQFYKRVMHTVTYEVDGGSEVAAENVLNGKTVAEPTAPTKEGYWFIGWYADSAMKALYDFTAPVMGNTTLYARFVEKADQQEFKVNFVVDGEAAFEELTTRGGVIYNTELPTPEKEGATFAGWWVSTYDDAEKLSYKYNEQEIGEDTTLYAVWENNAPAVSVTAEGVSWSAIGGSTYRVTIKNELGNNIGGTTTPETSYAFDFSQWAEGDYTVEVSVTGQTGVGTAYYQNKALDKVTYFNVSQDRVLSFNEIKNATKYLITVSCGDENHEHTQVETKSPVFDFSGCQMQEGGITFQVEAVANGYISSTSESYSFEAKLGELQGLIVNKNSETVSWNAVRNATSYMVEIIDDGVSLGKTETTKTNVSLKGLAGNLEVKVYPVARGYNSSETKSVLFENTRLAMPQNLRLEGHSVVWDAVEEATGYKVTIGNREYTVTSPELVLLDEHFTDNVSVITVQATCDDEARTSISSDACTVRSDNRMDAESLAYNNGEISWSPVLGASKYGVRLNGGEEFFVEDGTKGSIAFTQAGDNVIEVRSYNAEDEASEWVSETVTVYTIAFEAEGGVSVDPMYKAQGDSVTLPETEYQGYNFVGWYLVPNALENSGQRHEDSFLQGEGDLTLYAGYTSKQYTVNLELGALGISDTVSVDVLYNQSYTLPVPACSDVTKVFAGWWSEPNGQGFQYADLEGIPENVWRDARDVTLYASWYNVLKFTEVGTSNDRGYAVSKDDEGIRYVESITIPAEYNGLPVTTVEGGAFANCTNLKEINIPDTVKSIFISSDNQVDTGSAFEGCTRLERVNVYCVNESEHTSHEVFYESDSVGALIYNNPNTSRKEFKYLPSSYTGTYQIPDGVEVIPTSAFVNSRVTKIVIPASVTQIDSSAFADCSLLAELEFLPAAEGVGEQGLTIANGVFEGCTNLVELNLPARVSNLNLDIFENNLQRINIVGNAVANAGEVYHSIDGVLCKGTTLVYMPKGRSGDYRIPGGIAIIGESAFANCKYITSISIPAYVEAIEKQAFLSCTNMRTLTFEGAEGSPTIDISESAFYSCSSLTEIVLPANIGTVEKYAFGNTSKLKKVTVLGDCAGFAMSAFADNSGRKFYINELYLGANVQNVEIAGVFGTALKDVVVDSANKYIGSEANVLYGLDAKGVYTEILYYPASKIGDYVIPDTVKTIGANVFSGKTNLTGVTIPASVTVIGDYAFNKCTSIEFITFVEGTEALTIGEGAFYGVSGVSKMTIPARVTNIGMGAFANCRFTELTFEDGDLDLVIGDYAFKPVAENSSTGIPQYTSTSLKSATSYIKKLELPTRLITIGHGAFHGALDDKAVIDVVIPEGVTEIGNYAFAANSGMRSISLPSTLVKLGAYNDKGELTSLLVFDSCSYLATITVASENTSFKVIDGVLYGLKEGVATDLYMSPVANAGVEGVVNIPKTVVKIWDEAFYSNKYIQSITFNEGIEGTLTLGTDIFSNTVSLQSVQLPEGMTTITTNMFNNCDGLVSVTIPSTVQTIAVNAFSSCSNLASIKFAPTPEGQEAVPLTFADGTATATISTTRESVSVSKSCFSNCPKLVSLELPERTVKIGKGAFAKLNLTSITIPSTVTEIGMLAFYQCDLMTEVKFAEGIALSEIPDYAFYDCSALEAISIPASVKTIGLRAFQRCKSLTTVNFAEGLTTIEDYAFGSIITNYTTVLVPVKNLAFPASLEEIGAYAFAECADVETITFADGSALETIGESAFFNNTHVTEVKIPASVTTIETNAFKQCIALATVTFGEDSALKEIGNFAFSTTGIKNFAFPNTASTLKLGTSIFALCDLETVHLSAAVTSVTGVLDDCSSIGLITVADDSENFSAMEGQKVLLNKEGNSIKYIYTDIEGEFVVPENFVNIEANVFEGQMLMTKVVLPVSLKEIGDSAFKDCTGLKEIVFTTQEGVDHSLTKIGVSAFENCTALTQVVLPENVKELGNRAFYNCTALTTIKLNGALSTLGNYIFYSAGSKATALTVELSEGMTAIGGYMFQSASKLKEITIPSTVTKIGTYAFASNSSLASVEFTLTSAGDGASNLEEIGAYAFQACTSLTGISIPNSVTTFGDYVFTGCSKLTQAGLPANIKKIPTGMFASTGFTQFTIPSTVTEIGNYAFQNGKLTTLTIPAHVKTIGNGAFRNMTTLKTVTFEEPAEGVNPISVAINQDAFSGAGITALTLSSQVKTIGVSAFASIKVTSLVIPEGVTTISNNAFTKCTNLTSVTFGGAALKTVGTSIFNACTKLNSVTMREGLTVLGTTPFLGCTSTSFTTLNLPTTLTDIPAKAFVTKYSSTTSQKRNNTGINITSIDLTHVEKIGEAAFFGCKKLKEVTWSENLISVGKEAFYNCTVLEKADISSVSTIADSVFYGCAALTEVKIPDGLSKINNSMFYGCAALEMINPTFDEAGAVVSAVNLPVSVVEIGSSSFYGCEKLASISLANVTKLGASAFCGCESLTSVDISNVNDLAASVFKDCANLSDVKLSENLTSIGSSAFQNCAALTQIALPETLGAINSNAFRATGLTSIVIPQHVTILGTSATSASETSTAYTFADCENLTSVVLPENFELLGGYIFMNCTSLTSINLPNTVTQIGKQAFMNTGLTYVQLPEGLEVLGDDAFKGCASLRSFSISSENANYKTMDGALYAKQDIYKNSTTIKSEANTLVAYPLASIPADGVLILPEGCEGFAVGSSSTSVFAGCENLIEVVFPSTMTKIPQFAFSNCTSLVRITIPQTIMEIESGAFYKCSNLETLIFEDDGTADELVFTGTMGYSYIQSDALTEITVPARIKNVPNNFVGYTTLSYACQNLTTVHLAEGIESIGNNAFCNTGISSIKFPSTLKKIGNKAFSGTKLTAFTDVANVESIGDSAFEATALTSVKIPASVTSCGSNIFKNCVSLSTIEFEEGVTTIPYGMFMGCTSLTDIKLPASVKTIGNYAFQNSSITSIDLNSVEILGTSAFYGCKGLTSIEIPATVTSLTDDGEYDPTDYSDFMGGSSSYGLFYNCTNLASVKLPETLKAIGYYVFNGCTALTSINIPESVELIGQNAFYKSGLETVEIKNPNTRMYRSFSEARNLTTVVLPEGLQSLGYYTFYNCPALKNINIPSSVRSFDFSYANASGTVTTYEGYTFAGLNKSDAPIIESIVLPEGITKIPVQTFQNCASLKEITIPTSVTEIGQRAFYNCTGIESIVIPEATTTVESYAFGAWAKTQTIYVYLSEAYTIANWPSDWKSSTVVTIYNYTPATEEPETQA